MQGVSCVRSVCAVTCVYINGIRTCADNRI